MTDPALNQRAVERALARLLVDTSSRHTAVVRVGGATLFWQGAEGDQNDVSALSQLVAQAFEQNIDLSMQLQPTTLGTPQSPPRMLFQQGVRENIVMVYVHRTWVLYCIFAKDLTPRAVKARVREAAVELEALLPR